MKILICLAMSCGLTAILYFYLKQRLGVIETRLNTLTDLAQTLASELYQKEKQQLENDFVLPVNNSSDSESESDDSGSTDSECETDDESMPESMPELMNELSQPPELNEVIDYVFKEVKLEPEVNEVKQIPIEIPIEIDTEPIIVYKKDVTPEKLIEVSDDESVKQVAVDENSKLSLKELKQKVNDLGGPPLKTKQALINFLKKKV